MVAFEVTALSSGGYLDICHETCSGGLKGTTTIRTLSSMAVAKTTSSSANSLVANLATQFLNNRGKVILGGDQHSVKVLWSEVAVVLYLQAFANLSCFRLANVK